MPISGTSDPASSESLDRLALLNEPVCRASVGNTLDLDPIHELVDAEKQEKSECVFGTQIDRYDGVMQTSTPPEKVWSSYPNWAIGFVSLNRLAL